MGQGTASCCTPFVLIIFKLRGGASSQGALTARHCLLVLHALLVHHARVRVVLHPYFAVLTPVLLLAVQRHRMQKGVFKAAQGGPHQCSPTCLPAVGRAGLAELLSQQRTDAEDKVTGWGKRCYVQGERFFLCSPHAACSQALLQLLPL
jgi:hypothetical protein